MGLAAFNLMRQRQAIHEQEEIKKKKQAINTPAPVGDEDEDIANTPIANNDENKTRGRKPKNV